MDEARRRRAQRLFTHFVPETGEIVKVALDLALVPRQASGSDNAAHAGRKFHVGDDGFQPLAVGRIADLAADTSAMRGVWHQHAIAAGEAEIGGQRRTLVAAFFLHDLDEDDLAPLDHILDLVAPAKGHALLPRLVARLRYAALAARAASAA